jgi:hypothetical protein
MFAAKLSTIHACICVIVFIASGNVRFTFTIIIPDPLIVSWNAGTVNVLRNGVAKEKGTAIVQTIDPAFSLDRDKYFLDIALSPLPKLSRDQWYAEPRY